MAIVAEICNSIGAYEALAASVIAQTCEDYFADARALKNKDFRKYTEKGYKTKIENYRDWFLNPASDFNTFYKGVCTNEALLNGKEILNRLDMMVEDTEQFPENTFNFVAAVHP